jgi:hypothetical protein
MNWKNIVIFCQSYEYQETTAALFLFSNFNFISQSVGNYFPLKMLCSHLGLHAAGVKYWSADISRYLEGFCSDFLVSFTDGVLRTTSSALQWGGMVLIKWKPKSDAINAISDYLEQVIAALARMFEIRTAKLNTSADAALILKSTICCFAVLLFGIPLFHWSDSEMYSG